MDIRYKGKLTVVLMVAPLHWLCSKRRTEHCPLGRLSQFAPCSAAFLTTAESEKLSFGLSTS